MSANVIRDHTVTKRKELMPNTGSEYLKKTKTKTGNEAKLVS